MGCLNARTGVLTPYGRTASQIGANVWGGAMRVGVEQPLVGFMFESGFSTGQNGRLLGSSRLTQRPNDPNYQVGLLLYPVALAVRAAERVGVRLPVSSTNIVGAREVRRMDTAASNAALGMFAAGQFERNAYAGFNRRLDELFGVQWKGIRSATDTLLLEETSLAAQPPVDVELLRDRDEAARFGDPNKGLHGP